MRRDKRPFIVELKRGQKRPGTLVDLAANEPKQDARFRAQDALFGGGTASESPIVETDPLFSTPSTQVQFPPRRRILEALAPVQAVEEDLEAPRRGRKLGSKNKSKLLTNEDTGLLPKRPRGRPPRNPEGQVRSVAATPELEKAALKMIAKSRFNPPISPIPGGRMSHPIPMFEPPPKRKRGRPRKIRAPKFDWTVWASDEAPEPVPMPTVVQVAQVEEVDFEDLETLSVVPTLQRFENSGPRLRAGERWKRRIRVPGGGPARPRSQDG